MARSGASHPEVRCVGAGASMALRAVEHVVWSRRFRAVKIAAIALNLGYSVATHAQQSASALQPHDHSAEDLPLVGTLAHFRSSQTAPTPNAFDAPHNTSWHQKTSVDVEPSVENWTGYDGYRRVASIYGGATWAVSGNLRQDGLRLRLVNGGSLYSYSGFRSLAFIEDSVWTNFTGRAWFTDVLAGWQVSKGSTTIKVFGGYAWSNHLIGPYDQSTRVQGTARGVKMALEIWQNWTPRLWTSLDLSAAQPHRTFSAQLRTGWRLDDAWSIGPEANVTGHAESTLQRLGGFVRREDLVGEFTFSAGVLRARGDQPSGYGTAQYLRRY
jgi:Cellulose biosynthesis protein BcsS